MADPFSSTNSLVQNYRKFLQQNGKVDPRPDMDLTVELGQLLRSQGKFDEQAAAYPDFRDQFLEATQATDRSLIGEVGAGVRRGGRGLAGTVMGAGALGLDVVGADDTAKTVAKAANDFASGGEDNQPTVESMGDVRDFKGGVRYVAGKVGEAVPSIAEALVTATIGAAAGTAVEPGAGTVAGGVAGLVGKRAVKEMIAKGIAKRILGREVAEEGLLKALETGASAELRSAFVQQSRAVGARMGGAAAGALNSLALSSGEIYNDTGDPLLSLGAGAIAAIPDTILPTYVMGKFFKGAVSAEEAAHAGGFLKRLLTEAAKTTPIEAGTEAFQELVGIAAEKYHKGEPATLNRADLKRMAEAAVGGAAGGLVAAPLAAAPSGAPAAPAPASNPALDARRRAMTGEAAPAPVAPAAPTRGEILRDSMALPPDQQDARMTALMRLAQRTDGEDQELEVLQALSAQRPSTVAKTSTAAAPAATATAPAAVVRPPVAPPVVATGATPLVTSPTPPPVAVAPVAAPAPTAGELARRVQAVGNKLGGIVSQVPSLDTTAIRASFDALIKGKVSVEGVTSLESAVAGLEQQAVTEAARVASERAAKKQEVATARAQERDANLQKQADAIAARVRKQAEKAAKKLTPEVAAPVATDVVPTITPTVVEPIAPVVDPLKTQLDAALNPKFSAGAIAQDGVINFGQVAAGLSDRAAITPEVKENLRSFDFNGWLKGYFEKLTSNGKPGLFFDVSGNRSQTRIAVAFEMPDGRVIQAGVMPAKNVQAVGTAAGKIRGNAVQRMGAESRAYESKNGARSAAVYTKAIEPGGKKPVLFDDLVKGGAIPIDAVLFDAKPGEIYQEFSSRDEYEKALTGTERKAKSVRETPSESIEQTVAQPETAATPQQLLSEAFDEAPDQLEKILKRATEHGPEAAFAKLPKVGREQVEALLTQAGATQADLVELLRSKVPAAAATPVVALPAAPEAAPAASSGKLSLAISKNPKFGEKLFALINKSGGVFDEDFLMKQSEANRDAIMEAIDKVGVEWGDFATAVQRAFNNSGGNPKTFVRELGGAKLRADAGVTSAPARARDPGHFSALVERLRNQGFDVELIQRELGEGQDAFTSNGSIGVVMDDITNANLTNVVGLIHEVGHVEVEKLSPGMRENLSRAVNNTVATVRDGNLIKAAKNANESWDEKLVETLGIKLTEEGFGDESASLAQTIWRTVKDLYLRVGMAMLRGLNLEPSDSMVLSWFENNMRRRLGGDYDYRFIDLFRPFIESAAEKVSRFTVIDGQEIADLLDPMSGRLQRAEVLPDSVAAAEWNLGRFRLTRDEGYYKGKKFSEVITSVRAEDPPAPINPNLTLDTAVKFMLSLMQAKPTVRAADGRNINLQTGDSETARLLFGNNPQAISEGQRLHARAVHLFTAGDNRTRPRPEKLAGAGLIVSTLEKADLVLETPTKDARTPDQKNYVYVKLYNTPNKTLPTWHFVRVDQSGRLITQHTSGPFGGFATPSVEAGLIKAAPGEKKDGGSSERPPRHQSTAEPKLPLSEESVAGHRDTLAAIVNLVNPSGWSREKLSAAVLKGVADGAVSEDEAGPVLMWIERATPDERKGVWKQGGGGLLREENVGAELDMDYTEAMARTQAAGWGELMPTITRMKSEVGSQMDDAQFWKMFGRGDLPRDIITALEAKAPGASTAVIGGEKMTDPMNQRARYQAFRVANALDRLNRRRAATDEERLARHTDAIVDRAKTLNKIEREFRDADLMNATFNDELRALVKELAVDLDRGPDTAFAAGKLAGAIREVENLAPDAAIPDDYQRVFKSLLDGGGISAFDHLSAIAKLNLPLARLTVAEVVAAIKENAAADPRLASLVDQRPLMVALASLARNSTREMDLLQLRTMKDAAQFLSIKAELDEIRVASDVRLDEIAKGIEATAESQSLRDRLRLQFLKARRDFRSAQRSIQRAQENKLLRTRFADAMAIKAVELSRDVGAFSFWEASNGATYSAMQRADDGTWSAAPRTLRMVGDDITEQHDRVANDMAMNRLWLEDNQAQAGSRLYEEVRRQVAEISKLDFAKNYEAAHRFWFDRFLQPLGQKFASTGELAGAKIRQMLNSWQGVVFNHGDEVDAVSRRWNKALQEASESAGYSNPRAFFDEVVSDVIYHVESEPGRDEAGAMREARRAAKRRIPDGFTVADSFGDRLHRLLATHKEMSELLNGIAEKNGVYISDPRVRDPLTGKGNLQRHAIKYGWLTSTRRLRSETIRTLVNDMQGIGWSDDLFSKADETKVEELIKRYFTPSVVRNFVEPFVMKPGKEVFFSAPDGDGRASAVSQVDAQHAWADAGGDLVKFADLMFDRTNEANDRKGLPAYRAALLKRFGELYTMESRLAAKSSQAKAAFDPHGGKAHRVMDARTNDLIPPEHFRYDIFTPVDARRALTEVAFHAAFGRDGNGLDLAMADLKAGLTAAADRYRTLPGQTRKEKAAAAIAQKLDFKKLERAAEDAKNIRGWEQKLVAHFTGKEAVVGDLRGILDLAQLNMSLVLNQPKSGLWNMLSLLEYPLVYRGIGRSSVRASATAAKVFGREVTSSLLQAFGVNFLRVTDYAAEIADVVERRKTERLPFGTLLSDIGPDGRYADGGGIENKIGQVSRGIQTAMRKGVGGGGFNALWAPFNFISAKADTAIATANVQAFEMIVKRAGEYFTAHPEARDNPAFRFTAEQLGMKGGGWFSDEGAFNYFRERAVDYNLGNIEQVARDAMGRVATGERMLTRDQALGVSMMALNEISLQASVNTRPVEMIDNPILRAGGLMLGWPISKMNQIHDAMKTPDGKLTMASGIRMLGVMAAWSLPAGLAYSLLMDQYDEKLLNKKSNMRGIDPIAVTPIVGPLLALGADRGTGNLLGILERLARAGTYGLMGDFASSFANVVDPTSGQRDFDLNSRVLIYAQFANLRDSMRNYVHQDFEYTYQSIGRPLLSAIGGGGVLQATQIINNALGLTNAEAAVTNRINVGNWLRSAGREAGLELRAGGGRSSPTALSVWENQMQVTALSNDRVGFLEAYRHAIDVARNDGATDPEAKVLEGFKSRNPLASVFRVKPTDTEMGKLYAAMDEDGQRAVREATVLFENFTELIAPNPIMHRIQTQQRAQLRAAQPVSAEQLRRRVASAALGY